MMRQVRLGRNAFLMVSVLLVANVEAGVALDAEITFFSESSGLLVDGGGNPQAGIRVVRSWKRTPEDEPMIDETVTSPSGAFSFPAATGTRPMAGRLPGTPVIRQEITAFGPDGPVTLWKAVKTNLDPNGELEGRPLNLECRIDVEPNGDGPVWGTCREVSGQFAAAAKAGGGALELTWQWPAERSIETGLLVRVEAVRPTRRRFMGVRNSPSLAGSLPDPHDVVGTVIHGPDAFRGRRITLRVPGAEVTEITAGAIVALGLVEGGRVCVCVEPAPTGTITESVTWIETWACARSDR
jgi:hypothetical protein